MTYAGLSLAYWSVLIAALMPLACATIAKLGAFSQPPQEGGYDNRMPRDWMARQSGWRARANAAHANCYEALPFYIGAIVIAHQHSAFQMRLDLLAIVFVVLRLLYVLFYLADLALWRSAAWAAALAVNVAVLFI